MKAFIILALGLVVTACSPEQRERKLETEHYQAVKRQEIFKDCLTRIPKGPEQTRYNDWEEVVARCDSVAYSQSLNMDPAYEKPTQEVGDMCQQRDSLLEPGLVDKFDAFVCLRPQGE